MYLFFLMTKDQCREDDWVIFCHTGVSVEDTADGTLCTPSVSLAVVIAVF